MGNRNRYQQMQDIMTKALLTDVAAFIIFLITAGNGVTWLKVVAAIASIIISLGSLAFLFLSQELLKKRSLWLSTGFFSVFMCVLASLILAYP